MKNILLVTLLCFFFLNINAQESIKGYKFLDKPDYDKALEVFMKSWKVDSLNSAVNMGLAIIFADQNYKEKDYFRAWDYFTKANSNFSKLGDTEMDFLKQFFSDRDVHMHNRPLRFIYDYEMKLLEDKLIRFVREENNLEVAEHFIRVYPKSRYYENVIHIRNHLEFRMAEKANTLEAYHNFMTKYPDAAQIPKATQACFQLAFEQAKKENSVAAYNTYMKEFPKADQYFQALKLRDQLAFENAQKTNTIESLEEFIEAYPKSLQLMNARTILRKLLYDRAKQVNTLDSYNDFILRYPEGELFVDIFNLKTSVLGNNISDHFQGNKEAISWVKGFDYMNQNDEAGSICLTQDGNIIACGTRLKQFGDSTECWAIGLDLGGKILWNKTYGSNKQNHASAMKLANDGNILIGGWTGNYTDTAFRTAWMFKIAQNGNGIWERKFEGSQINDFTISSEGELYLRGYKLDDSLKVHLYLAKYSADFKKSWSRMYLKNGALFGFAINQRNEIICGSGKWIWKTDKQGYLVAEKFIDTTENIYSVNNINNQNYFIGSKLNLPVILCQNDISSIPIEITIPNYPDYKVSTILNLPNKQSFIVLSGVNGLVALIVDEKFKEIKHIEMPKCYISGPECACLTSKGEILLTITAFDNQKNDIVIMKLSL